MQIKFNFAECEVIHGGWGLNDICKIIRRVEDNLRDWWGRREQNKNNYCVIVYRCGFLSWILSAVLVLTF